MARGFGYFTHDGRKITDEEALEKIHSLVIPPAWKQVRISPASGRKIQAVGIDTAGRLQYIYHPKFTEKQQRKKFSRIERFGEFMPQLRRITNEHISLDGFPCNKVLAIMTRLINLLYIRMGTDHSVKQFRTYGITTLTKNHVRIEPKGKIVFEFVGKSRIKHKKLLVDADLSSLLQELVQLGRRRKLFQYLDSEEKLSPVTPAQINRYIKSITAPEYSAKDFRTWGASLMAASELAAIGVAEDERSIQKNIVKVVRTVAAELGNTPAVCRSSYIHPNILKAYAKGIVIDPSAPSRKRSVKKYEEEFQPDEIALLRLFKQFT